MAGADHGQESAQVQGGLQCTWGAGSFVCGHTEKKKIQEQPCQPRVAAGVVGNLHFAGVKVIAFCSS